MTIRVGTIVVPYIPEIPGNTDDWGLQVEGYKSCTGYEHDNSDYPVTTDICVGIIRNCDDIEQIWVEWLTSCQEHDSGTNMFGIYPINQLWEVGQLA